MIGTHPPSKHASPPALRHRTTQRLPLLSLLFPCHPTYGSTYGSTTSCAHKLITSRSVAQKLCTNACCWNTPMHSASTFLSSTTTSHRYLNSDTQHEVTHTRCCVLASQVQWGRQRLSLPPLGVVVASIQPAICVAKCAVLQSSSIAPQDESGENGNTCSQCVVWQCDVCESRSIGHMVTHMTTSQPRINTGINTAQADMQRVLSYRVHRQRYQQLQGP